MRPDRDHQLGLKARWPLQFGWVAWRAIIARVISETMRDNVWVLAAGIAFYAFLALFPAIAALVSIYGLVLNPGDITQLVTGMHGVVPNAVIHLIAGQLNRLIAHSGSALGLGAAGGLLFALWSANSSTQSIMTALNIAYEEQEKRSLVQLFKVSLLLTVGGALVFILAILLVVVVPSLIDLAGLPARMSWLFHWLRWPALALMMILALAVLYRFGPSRRAARWRWVTYGSVVATGLWLAASVLFSWYVTNFGSYDQAYGSLATIIILMLWFYISAYAVLIGAELNGEMEHQTAEDSTIPPDLPRGQRRAEMADRVAAEDEARERARGGTEQGQ